MQDPWLAPRVLLCKGGGWAEHKPSAGAQRAINRGGGTLHTAAADHLACVGPCVGDACMHTAAAGHPACKGSTHGSMAALEVGGSGLLCAPQRPGWHAADAAACCASGAGSWPSAGTAGRTPQQHALRLHAHALSHAHTHTHTHTREAVAAQGDLQPGHVVIDGQGLRGRAGCGRGCSEAAGARARPNLPP